MPYANDMPRSARRKHLGLHASAALPLLHEGLADRGWTHALFGKKAGLVDKDGNVDNSATAKILYGDARPGPEAYAFIRQEFGIDWQLFKEPCPKGWKPHGGVTSPRVNAPRARGRPAA